MNSNPEQDETVDLIAGLDGYWEAASRENVEEFLDAASDPDWLKHVNDFDLVAELQLIEVCDLDSTLIEPDIQQTLLELDASKMAVAYRALKGEDQPSPIAKRFVHLRCREVIRERLGLPDLSEKQIRAFFAASPPRLQPFLPRINQHEGRKCQMEDLVEAKRVMYDLYPTVVAYLKAASNPAIQRRIRGQVGKAGVSHGALNSVASTTMDADIRYASNELAWSICRDQ